MEAHEISPRIWSVINHVAEFFEDATGGYDIGQELSLLYIKKVKDDPRFADQTIGYQRMWLKWRGVNIVNRHRDRLDQVVESDEMGLQAANGGALADPALYFEEHATSKDALSPEEAIMKQEFASAILAGLQGLRMDERTTLVGLADGMTYGELAVQLDMKEPTVRKTASRARMRMREALSEYFEEAR